ncbi:MAG: hypothetical protein H7249_09135 [Chitinophagaceae bacterium]|nr:hypothetical protein [Oligoflexus sp.]
MKHFALALCLALTSTALAAKAPHTTQLREAGNDGRTSEVERVGDSVFLYQPSELNCDPNGDEETPCLAKQDHWQSLCFLADASTACSEIKSLFIKSSELLVNDGAEEDVQLVSCNMEYEGTIPTITYDLISGHGGPNVRVKGKMIPMCPIFIP